MVRCSAKDCSSSSDNGKHRWLSFPTDSCLRNRWIEAVGKDTWQPTKYSVLCSKHFSNDCWRNDKSNKLKAEAVPSVFCHCKNDEQSHLSSSVTVLSDHKSNNIGTVTFHRPSILCRKQKKENKENIVEYNGKSTLQSLRKRGRPKVKHLQSCPFFNLSSVQHQEHSEKEQDSMHPINQELSLNDALQPNCPSSSSFSLLSPQIDESFSNFCPSSLSVSTPHSGRELPVISCNNGLLSITNGSFFPASPTSPYIGSMITTENTAPATSTCDSNNNNLREELEECQRRIIKLEQLAARLTGQIYKAKKEKEVYRSRYRRAMEESSRFKNSSTIELQKSDTVRVKKWSNYLLKKGLKLHFLCGTVGYKAVKSELNVSLPSVRSLQRSIEHIKFSPGILTEVFAMSAPKTAAMCERDKECVIAFDEMAVERKVEFDRGLKRMIGTNTISIHRPKVTKEIKEKFGGDIKKIKKYQKQKMEESLCSKACKALAFILGGLFARWKQLVAYEFTGNSYNEVTVMQILLKIISESHKISLFVRCVVCDMGNRDVWRSFGLKNGPDHIQNSIPHPCNPEEKLFFTPDAVHVIKNILTTWASNGVICLPDAIIQTFNLSTSHIYFKSILQLQEYQKDMRWKLAPKIKSEDIVGGHYKKMKVGTALAVFNHHTAAALYYLSEVLDKPEMCTCAWFVSLVHQWFKLVASRNISFAFSLKNPEAYENSIELINVVMYVFKHMRFNIKQEWKPCQTGVLMASQTLLDLCEFYIVKKRYQMLMGGRMTSDIIENIFSRIRAARPNATPKQFRERLKKLCVSQCMQQVPGSSYNWDDREDLTDFLFTGETSNYQDITNAQSLFALTIPSLHHGLKRKHVIDGQPLEEREYPVFYRVCGYVAKKVFQEKLQTIQCQTCYLAVVHQGSIPRVYGHFTRVTDFTKDNLIEVSNEVFELLLECENKLLHAAATIGFNKTENITAVKADLLTSEKINAFPKCHTIADIMIIRFINMRLTMGFENNAEKLVLHSQLSSKTMGAMFLAAKLK